MVFKDVIGQKEVQDKLLSLQANNRLSHALLFIGKEGSGALALAMNFAQYLVSINSKKAPKGPEVADLFGSFTALPQEEPPTDNSSEEHYIDKKAADLMHPDLHFSYPVVPKKSGDKPLSSDYISEWRQFYKTTPYGNLYDWLQFIKAENRQGNITSDECMDIIRKLNLKAFEAPYKILVMWMPEMLGKEGNKLLKLIEEPPADTLFLLVAENESEVLGTIVSRCQIVKVNPLPDEDIADALVNRYDVPPEQARPLSLVCDGNFREALHLLQHNQENWNAILRDWLNATVWRGATEYKRFEMLNTVVATISDLGRERQKQLLRYFIQLLELSIRIRIIGEGKLNLPAEEKEFALKINKISGISTQQAMVKELENAVYFVERNANAKMLFHALTIKLRRIVLDKTLFLTQ
ncbi:DNA polymerase III subunit [Polluticaenibacter yanchengensis]|uniref:DNA polymerase III subunit delta n=1 Tax=Polluticaenibacter yanchengensis TaxID=3014562 RepID=A0ABT4UJT9_9BACT|nr:hypothetical protein [Chitinophagaceae bacterium LY-5]